MRILTMFAACALACALEMPAIAQEHKPAEAAQSEQDNEVLGTVVRGNTTIIFEAADTRDIDMTPLRTWGKFADEHPGIARTLAYKPSLINDTAYVKKHPELANFFQAHPDVKDAIVENPGNFEAIPPRPGE